MRTWRPTRLVSDFCDLEARLERELLAARIGRRARRELMLELLGVANGTREFERVPELVENHALPQRIARRIGADSDFALPRAIYENAFFARPIDAAIERGLIHRSEWAYVNRLARQLDVAPSFGQDKLDDIPRWKIEIDESYQTMRVWIRELALQDMLLAGMEAFLVPAGSGKPSTEIYGIVFGSYREAGAAGVGSRSPLMHVDLNVERVCIQHRAKGSPSEVIADERSETLHLAMGRELFPYWHLLGDFHTHTYRTLEQMHAVRGWNYSRYDEVVNVEWCARMRELGHRPRLALIMTLCRASRTGAAYQEGWGGQGNVLRATIGRCHCFVAAYRIRPDGRYSREGVTLKCPHLAGR